MGIIIMQRRCELCNERKPRAGFKMVRGNWRCPECVKTRCYFCDAELAGQGDVIVSASTGRSQDKIAFKTGQLWAHETCYYEASNVEGL